MPLGVADVKRDGTDITVIATGRTVPLALTAATTLAAEGIELEVIDPRTLKPLDAATIVKSVRKTNRLVVVNDGWRTCGYAAELMAVMIEECFFDLDAPIRRVCTEDVPMPVATSLQKAVMVSEEQIAIGLPSSSCGLSQARQAEKKSGRPNNAGSSENGWGVEDLELRDWPEPRPAPDEVKLKVAAAGICGTDIHIIKGEWPCNPPVVLGHEFCGTIVEVGSQVRRFKLNDRVVASNPAQTCGNCYHCRVGNPFMCLHRVSAGYMIDGAFAEYICIRGERCHLLPDHVSFRQAALGEPMSVAIHAVIERTTVHAGDLVLVSGPGAVGLLTMLVAKLEGARVIVAGITKDRSRLALAKSWAPIGSWTVRRKTYSESSEASTNEGADLVYECSGVANSLDLCWEAVRREGTLAQVGIYPSRIETDLNKVVMKELTVVGSFGYVWSSWRRCIQLLSEGRVNAEALISHELPLNQFQEAFRITQDGTATKVVFNVAMT